MDHPQLPVCVSDCVGSLSGSPDHPAALSPQSGSVHAGWSHRPGEKPPPERPTSVSQSGAEKTFLGGDFFDALTFFCLDTAGRLHR